MEIEWVFNKENVANQRVDAAIEKIMNFFCFFFSLCLKQSMKHDQRGIASCFFLLFFDFLLNVGDSSIQ